METGRGGARHGEVALLLDVEETRRRSGAGRARARRSKGNEVLQTSAALARLVEAEIIPRLMLAHQARAGSQPAEPPGPREIADFADLAVHGDVRQLTRSVDALRDRGLDYEAILLELLAPAARLLGERWLSDEATFADVTIGLTRLHHLLHEIMDLCGDLVPAAGAPRALLVPAAGEQHTFGLVMVEAFLRSAGWEVWPSAAGGAEATTLARQRHFDVVGISASCEARLDSLAALVRELRRTSCNAQLAVLVGGPLFVDHPEYAKAVGADAAARDGREACRVAERLVAKSRTELGERLHATGPFSLKLVDPQRKTAIGADA